MRRLPWLFLPLGILVADLASKAWIVATLAEGESRTVIHGFFDLTLGFNRGAIFGSLYWIPAKVRFALFAVAGLVALLYFGKLFLEGKTAAWDRVALGSILGGALGNGLDRILRGAVVDFLDFTLGSWHYWSFNLADSFILCGAILYGVRIILAAKAEPQAKEN